MLFPIGDQQIKGGYKPIFSYVLIAANIGAFLFQLYLQAEGRGDYLLDYGAVPVTILKGDNWISLFSSIFLHGGIMHLVGNMVFLWVFADNIEGVIGNVNFLTFYLLGGLAASLAHIFFNTTSMAPAIGASGAISAVLGAYLVMFPKSQIKVLFLFFFVQVPAILFLGIWIVQNVMSGVESLNPMDPTSGGVAWWAHIGGFVFGLVAGIYARKSYVMPDLHPLSGRKRRR